MTSRNSDFSSITYGNTNVSLPETLALGKIVIEDLVPPIQVEPQCIEVNLASSFNSVAFLDEKGYETPYNFECETARKLEALIEQGNNFINFMYTFRSVSKAVPELVFFFLYSQHVYSQYHFK